MEYPSLYFIVAGDLKLDTSQFREICKSYSNFNNPEFRTYYIHGYLIPKQDELRAQGKIKYLAKKSIAIDGAEYEYEGEVDSDGRPEGHGKAKYKNIEYEGIWE